MCATQPDQEVHRQHQQMQKLSSRVLTQVKPLCCAEGILCLLRLDMVIDPEILPANSLSAWAIRETAVRGSTGKPRVTRSIPDHRTLLSSIVCLIALISVMSGPNFLACSKMLRGACVCSCGTRTRSLSAIVSLPCCRRLRHEHNPVLISLAG